MREFKVFVISLEKGTGIFKENTRAVLSCGLSECLDRETVEKKFELGEIFTEGNSARVSGTLLYIDKRNNPDIVRAVRAALLFDADGVVIPFGNNKNRQYIKDGRAYTTEEMCAAVWETKRLAPLFGRLFVDGSL